MDLLVWHASGLGGLHMFNGLYGMIVSLDCMAVGISVVLIGVFLHDNILH